MGYDETGRRQVVSVYELGPLTRSGEFSGHVLWELASDGRLARRNSPTCLAELEHAHGLPPSSLAGAGELMPDLPVLPPFAVGSVDVRAILLSLVLGGAVWCLSTALLPPLHLAQNRRATWIERHIGERLRRARLFDVRVRDVVGASVRDRGSRMVAGQSIDRLADACADGPAARRCRAPDADRASRWSAARGAVERARRRDPPAARRDGR